MTTLETARMPRLRDKQLAKAVEVKKETKGRKKLSAKKSK